MRKVTQAAAATIDSTSGGLHIGDNANINITRRDRNAHRLLQQSSSTPAILH